MTTTLRELLGDACRAAGAALVCLVLTNALNATTIGLSLRDRASYEDTTAVVSIEPVEPGLTLVDLPILEPRLPPRFTVEPWPWRRDYLPIIGNRLDWRFGPPIAETRADGFVELKFGGVWNDSCSPSWRSATGPVNGRYVMVEFFDIQGPNGICMFVEKGWSQSIPIVLPPGDYIVVGALTQRNRTTGDYQTNPVGTWNVHVASVPEPSTLAIAGGALSTVWAVWRRRKNIVA